ncbi:MAG: DUF6198 family protein [Clostridiales bacterium]|nr:DUF6198 family protein [Clostridiales bacterium]
MQDKSETQLKNMSAGEIIRRSIFLIVSLFVMAFGVAFSIKGNLGTSPISSFPYALSMVSSLTVGQATIALHCTLIALQILILRKRYQLIQLLQLPVALVFGVLTDFTLNLISGISPSSYPEQWLCCAIGIVLVATGVSMEVTSKIVTLAGEGFVLTVCKVAPVKFSTMKVIFDVSLVALACLVSFVFLRSIEGVREGTLAAAILVGTLTRQINKWMAKFEGRFLCP